MTLQHHWVEIQRDDSPPGGSGARKKWSRPATVARRFAGMEHVQAGSREIYGNQKWTTSVNVYRFQMRRVEGINTDMRVVLGGRVFNIQSVPDVPRQRQIVVICQEVN